MNYLKYQIVSVHKSSKKKGGLLLNNKGDFFLFKMLSVIDATLCDQLGIPTLQTITDLGEY